jgi:hypothetical protein
MVVLLVRTASITPTKWNLFNKERLRTMTLNKNAILNQAVYTYHPGEIDYVKLTSK